MKILAISDLHGELPRLAPADVVIIGGDVLPLGTENGFAASAWIETQFSPWLSSLDAKEIIGIAGNHDFLFEAHPEIPQRLPWYYLLDSGCEIDGVSFWGSPWTPNLPRWAFYGSPRHMSRALKDVPPVDVTITHCPPDGAGDGGHPEWTDPAIRDMIQRVKPKVHISGHIHEGHGRYEIDTTTVYNAAYMDFVYVPGQKPWLIDIESRNVAFPQV